jgi:glutathione S-transferase
MEEQEAAREAAVDQLQVLEEKLALAGNEFFAGQSVGLVDLSLGALAYVVPMYEEIIGVRLLTEERFPSLYAWMERFLGATPVKDHLPPMEELKLRFRAIREYFLKNTENMLLSASSYSVKLHGRVYINLEMNVF